MRTFVALRFGLVFLFASIPTAALAQFGIPPTEGRKQRPEVATAPPIEWVESLDEATSRARKLGRPLFIFFHSSAKGSRLMEVGTVNTPEIQLRTPRFVCVQLDPELELDVARRFGLKVNQAIVIADAEGKVLKKLEGNPRVEEIAAAMDSVLREWGPIPTEADLRAMEELLERARRERAQGRMAEAHKLLSRIVRTNARCESVLLARAELDAIAAEGEKALSEANSLAEEGKFEEAISSLRKLARAYERLPIGDRAKEALGALEKGLPKPQDPAAQAKAKRLLDMASGARTRGRLDDELDALAQAVALLSGEEKTRVEARIAEIRSDPELSAKLAAQFREREAKSLLAKAKSWINNRAPEKARGILQELLARYPEVPQAEEARELLDALGK